MKTTIDIEIYDNFHNAIIYNHSLINYYSNVDGKNKWSVIQSCMDWIYVAANYLIAPKEPSKSKNVRSMKVYTYISAIDIILEAIEQLHRVAFNTKKAPFECSYTIFPKEKGFKSDTKYFKHIRAVFGAHPVNLSNSLQKNDDEKWFASWSNPKQIGIEYDYHVILNSNRPGQKYVYFGFKYAELNQFLNERYSYLNTILDRMLLVVEKHKDENDNFYRNEQIEKPDSNLEQLYILKQEAERRYSGFDYQESVSALILIFESTISGHKYHNLEVRYKVALQRLVDEIYDNLQSMEFPDLKNEGILNPQYPKFTYDEVRKLYCMLPDRTSDPLYRWCIDRVNEHANGKILLSEKDLPGVTYLKLNLMAYFKLWKTGIIEKEKDQNI